MKLSFMLTSMKTKRTLKSHSKFYFLKKLALSVNLSIGVYASNHMLRRLKKSRKVIKQLLLLTIRR